MSYTFEELKHKTVADLRKIAQGIEDDAVQGYTQLNKEHLLEAICKALKIDMFVHHHAVGINKAEIKRQIRGLKTKRDELLQKPDYDKKELKNIRKHIHLLKNRLRNAMV